MNISARGGIWICNHFQERNIRKCLCSHKTLPVLARARLTGGGWSHNNLLFLALLSQKLGKKLLEPVVCFLGYCFLCVYHRGLKEDALLEPVLTAVRGQSQDERDQ